MQIFRLPNRKQVYGVNFERPRGPSKQSPEARRQYMELEQQLRGVTALSAGLSGRDRRRLALGPTDIERAGMYDSIDGVQVLGAMSLRHTNGQQLSLLFISDPNATHPGQPQAPFCFTKVPSQGRWSSQQEFVINRKEYDLLTELLPVICDPYYEGSRVEGLAVVTQQFNIMPNSMSTIPGTDGAALNRICSDTMGRSVISPSKPKRGPYDDDDDERDGWDDPYRDEDDYDRRDDGDVNEKEDDDLDDDAKYYDPRDVYADPYADRRHRRDDDYDGGDDYDDRYDDGYGDEGYDDENHAYRIPDRPQQQDSPVVILLIRVLLILLALALLAGGGFLAYTFLVAPRLG